MIEESFDSDYVQPPGIMHMERYGESEDQHPDITEIEIIQFCTCFNYFFRMAFFHREIEYLSKNGSIIVNWLCILMIISIIPVVAVLFKGGNIFASILAIIILLLGITATQFTDMLIEKHHIKTREHIKDIKRDIQALDRKVDALDTKIDSGFRAIKSDMEFIVRYIQQQEVNSNLRNHGYSP